MSLSPYHHALAVTTLSSCDTQATKGARPSIALRPEHAPLAVLIEACWDADVALRPSMGTVVEALI